MSERERSAAATVVEASGWALVSTKRGPAAAAGRGDPLDITDTSVISWALASASSAPVGAAVPVAVSRASDSNWLIMLCSSLAGAAACGCSRAVAAGHAVVMVCARRWRSNMIAAALASMIAALEVGTWVGSSAMPAPGVGGAGETTIGALVAAGDALMAWGDALWTSSGPSGACCRTVVGSLATPAAGGPSADFCGEIATEPTLAVVDAWIVGAAPVFAVIPAVDRPASLLTMPASWEGCVATTAKDGTSSVEMVASGPAANVVATLARNIATTTTATALTI
jgi:hypothetical protein